MSDAPGHLPVMLEEVLEQLRLAPDRVAADLTLGAGGHAEAILEATAPNGRLFAFDRDPIAIELARGRLSRFGDRLVATETSFVDAPEVLDEIGAPELDGVLMDVGVSSMQLDDPARGFSIRNDGPLDMRMSPKGDLTAARLLESRDADELERIFFEYGEEPRGRAIARKIVELRKRTRITTTRELAELVRSVTGSRGRIHPATRVFQALRIAVNGELDGLEKTLPMMIGKLAPKGRIAVISFHSLEDRIVKRAFKGAERDGIGRALTARPLLPSREETERNPRSRSARLRCFEMS